jgi:hypothetical protein
VFVLQKIGKFEKKKLNGPPRIGGGPGRSAEARKASEMRDHLLSGSLLVKECDTSS